MAEICYHMHASAFHVYGQLYTLISEGVARVAGEAPEETPPPLAEIEDLPESVTEMVWSAERKLEQDPDPVDAAPIHPGQQRRHVQHARLEVSVDVDDRHAQTMRALAAR